MGIIHTEEMGCGKCVAVKLLEKMRENGIPTVCTTNDLLTLTHVTEGNTKISANANEVMDLTVATY